MAGGKPESGADHGALGIHMTKSKGGRLAEDEQQDTLEDRLERIEEKLDTMPDHLIALVKDMLENV